MSMLWLSLWVTLAGTQKMAIVDFDMLRGREDDGESEISRVLMAELERELQVEFDIVERRKLETIRKERGIALTESSDPEEVKKVWKLLAADYTLVGTITEFRVQKREFNSAKYNVHTTTHVYYLAATYRMIESSTGQVLVVGSESVRTDTRELRREGLDDGTFRTFLCGKLALAVRKQLVRDLRAWRERGE